MSIRVSDCLMRQGRGAIHVSGASTLDRGGRGVPGEDLDAGAVLSVYHGDVLNVDVGDDVGLAGVLAEGTDGDAVGAIALQVGDVDVGCVGFEGDAVVVWEHVLVWC